MPQIAPADFNAILSTLLAVAGVAIAAAAAVTLVVVWVRRRRARH